MTAGGEILFKDLTGNGLQQGIDFILCEDEVPEAQIFSFNNIHLVPDEGIFIVSDDESQVYQLFITEYGALTVEPSNKIFK